MFNLLNKIFYPSKNLNIVNSKFSILKKETNIEKIFKAIETHSLGAELRYVGGCVRKILNNEQVDDIDLAANIEPIKVKEVLQKNEINFYETGIAHGTITAVIENEKYEITSLRSDVSTDGRHAKVKFTDDWCQDAERRDFTINSIYCDINGNLFDPFDGKKDLENGKVIFVGDVEKRIKEDYLRILRYIRFFSNYSKYKHDLNVQKAIKKNIKGITNVSSDRLLDEFRKIYKSNAIKNLCEDNFSFEIIKLIFPQFKNLEILKNLNDFRKKNLKTIDFCFLLSLLVVDETDNSDYFIYKFNISKKDQKRILIIKNFFYKKSKNKKINTKNLWKVFYKYGKVSLKDILNYKLFNSKKIDKKIIEHLKFFDDKNVPIFPIKGEELMKKFDIPQGKKLGENLKLIEDYWLNNNFEISDKELEKIIKN